MYKYATFDGNCPAFDCSNDVHKVVTFDYTIIILPSSDPLSLPIVYTYQSEGTIIVVGSSYSTTRIFVVSEEKVVFKSKIVPFWIGNGTVFERKDKNKLLIGPWLVGDPCCGRTWKWYSIIRVLVLLDLA